MDVMAGILTILSMWELTGILLSILLALKADDTGRNDLADAAVVTIYACLLCGFILEFIAIALY